VNVAGWRSAALALGLLAGLLPRAAEATCDPEQPVVRIHPAEPPPGPDVQPSPRAAGPRHALVSAAASSAPATGGLAGITVYLNPGHGWTWRSGSTWGTQRDLANSIVEDLSNIDLVTRWIAEYLRRGGGDAVACRELDPQTNMVVVDNGDGVASPGNGTYEETGVWYASSLAGHAGGYGPYDTGSNPFTNGGNRLADIQAGVSATARWTPNIPEAGYYHVGVSWSAFSARSTQAHYVVRHPGGETHHQLNQRRQGATWVDLGRYYFEAGFRTNEGCVELWNDTAEPGALNVSADAARFGGGMGLIRRNGSRSGKPRHEEEARYHLQYQGLPVSDYDFSGDDESDGWTARLRYFAWRHEPGELACAISLHSNAGGGSGTRTYLHDSTPGPDATDYRNRLHDELTNVLRTVYDPAWSSAKSFGSYGENNGNNVNNEMPVVLVEYAFHDHVATDARYMRDPTFRRLVARGLYHGVVRYFATEYGRPDVFLPEPPARTRALPLTGTTVRVAWDVPPSAARRALGDPATGYRVYQSRHGYAFDGGTPVTNRWYDLDAPPGTTIFVRVTACNAGGESLPSPTLPVRTAAGPRLLLVNGFDKLDESIMLRQSFGGGTVFRDDPEQVNGGQYLVPVAQALDAGFAIASCERSAVASNLIETLLFDALVWESGLQCEVSTTDARDDTSLTTSEKTVLAEYLAGGGRLLMCGAEVAWDLDRAVYDPFLRDTLGVTYVSDDSETNAVRARGAGPLGAAGPLSIDEGAGGVYPVRWPDTIEPWGDGAVALYYGSAPTVLDAFASSAGWWDPNTSGQTVADPSSTFTWTTNDFVSPPGAGQLDYLWASGGYIREYLSTLPVVPTSAVVECAIRGDASGNELAACFRDPADNDLFLTGWTLVDWTGWRMLAWDLQGMDLTPWVTFGDGRVTGTTLRFDSFHLRQRAALAGMLRFDDLRWQPGDAQGSPIAAVATIGSGRSLFAGFPLAGIIPQERRTAFMREAITFLLHEPDLSIDSTGAVSWTTSPGFRYDLERAPSPDTAWLPVAGQTNLPPAAAGARHAPWPPATDAMFRVRARLR
jgi:N-acetylmuramoyl-L-alanine amidase